jgi:hypothetical protein
MARNVPRNPYMKTILLVFVTITINQVASAQLISIGAKGGVPFLDSSQGNDQSRPYIVGPSVEVRLPAGFAIEVDALYRRLGNTSQFGLSGNVTLIPPPTVPYVSFFIDRFRGNSWEFPLLGKYYFRPRTTTWQPYIATGWSLRTIGLHQSISNTITDPSGASHSNSFRVNSRSDLGVGAVFAAGLRYRVGRLALLPEIRYTRWGSSNSFSIRKDEAGVLLGISF